MRCDAMRSKRAKMAYRVVDVMQQEVTLWCRLMLTCLPPT
jgi:hypothetical protein